MSATKVEKKPIIQSQTTEGKINTNSYVDDLRPAQLKRAQLQDSVLQRNDTPATETSQESSGKTKGGLPEQIKSGVESMSGQSMDDVKVHYNSPQPAKVDAHAFAQGRDIYLGPGQEKHLGHEAWHIAQQAQGRVQPTAEVNGLPVNDHPGLEQEADRMGSQVMQQVPISNAEPKKSTNKRVIQRSPIPTKDHSEEDHVEHERFEATIQQHMFVLRGKSSFWGWLRNSTFTQLHAKVNEYAEAPEEKKDEILKKVRELGQRWLNKHGGKSQKEDHLIKENSIRRILQAIDKRNESMEAKRKRNEAKQEASKPSTSVGKVGPDASAEFHLATTDDKVGIFARIKKFFTGKDSTFMQLQDKFTRYQDYFVPIIGNSSEKGFSILGEAMQQANEIYMLAEKWIEKHSPKDKSEFTVESNEKMDVVFKMRDMVATAAFSVRLNDHIRVYSAPMPLLSMMSRMDHLGIEIQLPNDQKYRSTDFSMMILGDRVVFDPYTFKGNAHINKQVGLTSPNITLHQKSGKPHIEADGWLAFNEQVPHVEGGFKNARTRVVLNNMSMSWEGIRSRYGFNATIDKDLQFDSESVDITTTGIVANEAQLDLKVMDKAPLAKGIASNVEMSTKGFDWTKTPLSFSDHFILNKLVSLASINLYSEGSKTDYKRTAVASNLSLNTGFGQFKANASNGSISVMKKAEMPRWAADVLELDLNMSYGSYFNLDAKKIRTSFTDEELSIENVKLTLGKELPGDLIGLEAEAENLMIRRDSIDWDTITVSSPNEHTANLFNDTLSITAPNEVEVQGKTQKYKTTFKGSKAHAKIGESVTADGEADFSIQKGVGPAIEYLHVEVHGESPTIPPTIKPFWPIEVQVPFQFGAAPISGYFSLSAGGGFAIAFDGSIDYKSDSLTITGDLSGKGKVEVAVTVGAGLGSTMVVYVGGYAEGKIIAEASAGGELKGVYEGKGSNLSLKEANLDYHLSAGLTANLNIGAEARALYFFRKKLYEVKAAEWKIGESTRRGSYSLLTASEDSTKVTGTGPLAGDKKSVPTFKANDSDTLKGDALDAAAPATSTGVKKIDGVRVSLRDLLGNSSEEKARLSSDSKVNQISNELQAATSHFAKYINDNTPWQINFLRQEKRERFLKAKNTLDNFLKPEAAKIKAYITSADVASIKAISDAIDEILNLTRS